MQGYNPDYSGLLNAGAQQAQALGSLGAMGGQLLGQRRQQNQAQQYQQQQQQEVSDALASGNPAMVAQVSMKYPELSDALRKSFEFQSDATENNFKSTNFGIIADPASTEQLLTDRVNFLESMGADATKPKARLEMYRANPEKFIETTRGLTAAAYPKEFSEYEKAVNAGKPEAMTAYQQATINTKKVDQDLRKLEIEQKQLDAQYKRETDDLKRSELEQKIEANKVEREAKTKETKDGLDSAYSGVIDTLNLADAIESHKGFSKAVGIQSAFPTFPGSDAAGVEGMIETLSSQNFLNSIQNMKGMGALSDAEGKKLSSAVASLNTNMSESDFKKALNVIKGITRRGKQKIESSYKAKGLEVPSIDNVYSQSSVQQNGNSEYQTIGNYRVKVK